MSDQKSEHARRPGRLRISALFRRAASSTESMLRGDPIKLKDVLDEHNMELAGLALVCGWDGEEEAANEREAADSNRKFENRNRIVGSGRSG